MHTDRPLRASLLVALLCGGCNIVYSVPSVDFPRVDASTRTDGRSGFDIVPRDTSRTEVSMESQVGRPCEDAPCPSRLACAPRSCGPERSCVVPVTLCGQEYEPVCDCTGTTLQNECAARASGVGVRYAGPCDGRSPDGGSFDATSDAAAVDAGPNRCARADCDSYRFVCCAEPTSPAYGSCVPVECPTCCRRVE